MVLEWSKMIVNTKTRGDMMETRRKIVEEIQQQWEGRQIKKRRGGGRDSDTYYINTGTMKLDMNISTSIIVKIDRATTDELHRLLGMFKDVNELYFIFLGGSLHAVHPRKAWFITELKKRHLSMSLDSNHEASIISRSHHPAMRDRCIIKTIENEIFLMHTQSKIKHEVEKQGEVVKVTRGNWADFLNSFVQVSNLANSVELDIKNKFDSQGIFYKPMRVGISTKSALTSRRIKMYMFVKEQKYNVLYCLEEQDETLSYKRDATVINSSLSAVEKNRLISKAVRVFAKENKVSRYLERLSFENTDKKTAR